MQRPAAERSRASEVSHFAGHQAEVVDLEVTGGEVVMPHQGEPLGEGVGTAEHAVDPPALETARLRDRERQVGQAVGELAEVVGGLT